METVWNQSVGLPTRFSVSQIVLIIVPTEGNQLLTIWIK